MAKLYKIELGVASLIDGSIPRPIFERKEIRMRYIMVVLLVLLVIGCGAFDRSVTSLTGKPAEICVDGVSYLQFTTGTSVKYTTDGRVFACK